MPLAGAVREIWRYPVKSMYGERLDNCAVGPRGIFGDRGWALREASGKNASAKRHAALMLCSAAYCAEPSPEATPPAEIMMPDGRRLRTDEAGSAQVLSDYLGSPLAWDRAPGTHFDAHPIHLLSTSSLEALSKRTPGSRFDARRFRPNFLIDPAGQAGGFIELDWCGHNVLAGEVRLHVKKPTVRCVMTTHPQADLEQDPSILRALVQESRGNLGVYAQVVSGGTVRVGDPVIIEAAN